MRAAPARIRAPGDAGTARRARRVLRPHSPAGPGACAAVRTAETRSGPRAAWTRRCALSPGVSLVEGEELALGSFPASACPRPAATSSPCLGPGRGPSWVSSNALIKTVRSGVHCSQIKSGWKTRGRTAAPETDGVRWSLASPSRSRKGRTPFRHCLSDESFVGRQGPNR